MEIYLKPDDMVDFFYNHYAELKESMVEIAEDSDSGIFIYLTEQRMAPCIVVKDDDVTIEEIVCVDFSEEETLEKCYRDYLGYNSEEPVQDLQDVDNQEISEREDRLLDAWFDFLCVVFDEDPEVFDDAENVTAFENSMDDILGILATEYGFSIYRPMFIENSDGVEEYEEYPYN